MSVGGDWPLDQGKDADLLLSVRSAFPPDEVTKIGVAVSGGGDSIALLHLLHRAAVQTGWSVAAVTVDHGLRPEAAAEAVAVARFCESLGVPHTTLLWEHGAITGNVMDAARMARMRLMREWALREGIGHLALGHTADDQAETFVMGLARASGLDGLAGMRHVWREDGIMWGRPVLGHSRAVLRSYLRRHEIDWIDDPSNENEAFTRIKARKALATLAPLGITVDSLTTTVGHLSMARLALRDTLRAAVDRHAITDAGQVQINRPAFDALHLDVQRRLLLAAISWLSGDTYPPRKAKQAELVFRVREGRDATLAGCRIRVGDASIRVVREPKAVKGKECPTDQLWDNRWHLSGPHAPDLTIRALGEGIRQVPNWRTTGLPRDTLVVSPAIWRGDALIAAPLAGFSAGWSAKITQSFSAFILSH